MPVKEEITSKEEEAMLERLVKGGRLQALLAEKHGIEVMSKKGPLDSFAGSGNPDTKMTIDDLLASHAKPAAKKSLFTSQVGHMPTFRQPPREVPIKEPKTGSPGPPPPPTEDEQVIIHRTAEHPTLPMWNGSVDRADRIAHWEEYSNYVARCEAASTPYNQAVPEKIGMTVLPKHYVLIMAYGIGVGLDQLSHEAVEYYFKNAYDSRPKPRCHMPTLITENVIMPTDSNDAENLVMKWKAQYCALLQQYDYHTYNDVQPKQAIKALVETIRPVQVQTVVRNDLDGEYRSILGNVQDFFKLVQFRMEAYYAFVPDNAIKAQNKRVPANARQNALKAVEPLPPRPPNTRGDGKGPTTNAKGEPYQCFNTKCKGKHLTYHCPKTTYAEYQTLLKAHRAARNKARQQQLVTTTTDGEKTEPAQDDGAATKSDEQVKKVKKVKQQALKAESETVQMLRSLRVVPEQDSGTTKAVVHGVVTVPDALWDTGADTAVVTRGLLVALKAQGKPAAETRLDRAVSFTQFDGSTIKCDRTATLAEVSFATSEGNVLARNGVFHVLDSAKIGLTLSRPMMNHMGYGTDTFLTRSRALRTEWDLGAVQSKGFGQQILTLVEGDDDMESDDEVDPDPDAMPHDVEIAKIRDVLATQVKANSMLNPAQRKELQSIVDTFLDVFRLQLRGDDPHVKVAPLDVELTPDATPFHCQSRRYPPTHVEYLRSHLRQLIAAKRAVRVGASRYASPAYCVPKGTSLRMTLDCRRQNQQTVPKTFPMPDLEGILLRLQGAKVFVKLDAYKFFWQLALALKSQEYFTFMTPDGLFQPTSVPMGCVDAVAYAQSTMHEVFGADLMATNIMAWVDDIIIYAKSVGDMMDILRRVLQRCLEYGLKLHPEKCEFFSSEVTWCGRVFSEAGISHDPARIQGIVDMSPPQTGAELQQLLGAAGWMRASIPRFSSLTAPLVDCLEVACQKAGSRNSIKLKTVTLAECDWGPPEISAFEDLKQALIHMVPLATPDPDKIVLVSTDASQTHWSVMVTQIPAEDANKPIAEQRHELLACISGSFKGSSANWSVVEKEAYALVMACRRLDYLLLRPGGFIFLTDHRNLIYIFNPSAVTTVQKYQAAKLARWATTLRAFTYTIHHVSGEDNVWADILTRWGAPTALYDDQRSLHVLALYHVPDPLAADNVAWPSGGEIRCAQDSALTNDPEQRTRLKLDEARGVYTTDGHRVWLPRDAKELQLRISVIGHMGISGHRGKAATATSIATEYYWDGMSADIADFVGGCLHCLRSDGSTVPRPYGAALHSTTRNEVLHFDFIYMDPGYLLVLKEDCTGYARLIPCDAPTADAAVSGLIGWFAEFGPPKVLVSDRGSHFRNQVVQGLTKQYAQKHHFTLAYCPWSNGTIEVVNRLLVKIARALLSEMKLPPKDWRVVLPLVQSALNHTPSDRLDGASPAKAFLNLEAAKPITIVVHPTTKEATDLDTVLKAKRQQLAEAAKMFEYMHRELDKTAQKRRDARRKQLNNRAHVKSANFEIGDYVLIGKRDSRFAKKLSIRWDGPARVIATINDWIYEVQDLRDNSITQCHITRLKHYRDASLKVTTDLVDSIAHAAGGHFLDRILAIKQDPTTKAWQVHIKWLGLDEEDSSWEPLATMLEDIPKAIADYVRTIKSKSSAKKIARVIESLKVSTD
jgi:hypothetical protein